MNWQHKIARRAGRHAYGLDCAKVRCDRNDRSQRFACRSLGQSGLVVVLEIDRSRRAQESRTNQPDAPPSLESLDIAKEKLHQYLAHYAVVAEVSALIEKFAQSPARVLAATLTS